MTGPFLQIPPETMVVSMATGTTNALQCYKLSWLKDCIHPGRKKKLVILLKQIKLYSDMKVVHINMKLVHILRFAWSLSYIFIFNVCIFVCMCF